jgi:molecular chaperone Hsp33
LQGLGGRALAEARPVYHCGCDERRVLNAVAMLGAEELADAIARGESLEVRCEFCAERYAVDPARARALLESPTQ